MCRPLNIEVMGLDPVHFLYNTELNKLVTQKFRIEIMSLPYHPLHLADLSNHAIVVHRGLALSVCPVLLLHGSELIRRPILAEPVPSLQRLNQPIDPPLKVLLLGQIDPVDLGGLHLPLQHLRAKKYYIWMSKSKINNYKAIVEDGKQIHLHVVGGNRYAAGVPEGIFYHLLCGAVEDEVGCKRE
jgi:hypothetical protein